MPLEACGTTANFTWGGRDVVPVALADRMPRCRSMRRSAGGACQAMPARCGQGPIYLLDVARRKANGLLLPARPVAWTPPVMCNGKNSEFLCSDLVDDAVREPAQDVAPTRATKHGTEQRVGQDEMGCPFKFGHKRETQLGICFQRVERGCILEFGQRRRRKDELHFSDARTWASASANGMTCTAPLSRSEILRSVSAAHASSISASSSRLASNS